MTYQFTSKLTKVAESFIINIIDFRNAMDYIKTKPGHVWIV